MSDIHYYSMRFDPVKDEKWELKLKDICKKMKINYLERAVRNDGKKVYEIACTPKEYDALVNEMFY